MRTPKWARLARRSVQFGSHDGGGPAKQAPISGVANFAESSVSMERCEKSCEGFVSVVGKLNQIRFMRPAEARKLELGDRVMAHGHVRGEVIDVTTYDFTIKWEDDEVKTYAMDLPSPVRWAGHWEPGPWLRPSPTDDEDNRPRRHSRER
jgi:hypothetical protein